MLRRLYLWSKEKSDVIAQRIINFGHKLYGYASRLRNKTLRVALYRLSRILRNIATLWLHFPRLEVSRIVGNEGSIIYVGKGNDQSDHTDKLDILHALFPAGYEETELSRVAVWKLSHYVLDWMEQNNMVICRVSHFFPWYLPGKFAFDNPLRVNQMLPLEKMASITDFYSALGSRRIRRYIDRMLAENYSVKESRSIDKLRYFYEHMYLPTMQLRHDNRAVIAPFETLSAILENGGILLLLELDGKEVGGVLNISTKDGIFQGEFLGYLDASKDLLNRHIGMAQYWYSIKHAIDIHSKAFNLMASVAWVSNGVFFYKQGWGAWTFAEGYVNEKILFRTNNLTPEWCKHINKLGFITEVNGKFLRVYLEAPEDSLKDAFEDALRNGLNGIQVVTENGHQNYFDPPP
jgi:hypothetical protein